MVIFHLIDFPRGKVKACCTETPEGDLIVFIDSHRSYEDQLRAARHELRHINDFEKVDVQEIELDAHT